MVGKKYVSRYQGKEIDDLLGQVSSKVDDSMLGAAGGVATLDTSGKIPSQQMPENVAYTNKENTFTERQCIVTPYDSDINTQEEGFIDAGIINVSRIKYTDDTKQYYTDNDAIFNARYLQLKQQIKNESGLTQHIIQLDHDGIKQVDYGNNSNTNYGYIFPKTYPNQNVTLATIEDLNAAQSDYNQNDSTARDYIKNRPFYEETSLTELADFKVISGNLKEVGSEVTVEYNGERFTGTVTEVSGDYALQIEGSEQAGFGGEIGISDEGVEFYYSHKKTYKIKSGDEIIFNGVKYLAKLFTSGELAGKFYISDGEIDPETLHPISSASFTYFFSVEDEGVFALDYYVIYKSTTDVDFNIKINQGTIKTIDPKFIKDMYYETTNTETLLEQTFSTHPPVDAPEENLNVWETTDSKIPFVEGETVKVLFNGTEYTQTVKKRFGHVLYIGNIYIFTEDAEENTGEPFAVANTALSTLKDGTTIITEQPQTNATIKVYKSEDIIKTIDHKYIKDMYYSTEAFVPFIDFEVISGDINTIGSTMVVKYDGKEYTEIVKDAAEEGSSDHIPYIGFKMGETATPTEEQPFCYGVNIIFGSDTKQLFCAAPKTVLENEAIIYNGENKTVKKMTVGGLSVLYVGNIHLISADFEDTGEQYLTLFDYFSVATQGKMDFVVSIVPQDGISCEIKSENISYINPKYIKDMYYAKSESEIQKTLVFKGEINGFTEEFPSSFEVGDAVSLKEDSIGLNVVDYAKKYTIPSGTMIYIGNLYMFAAIGLEGVVDTKEDYCLICIADGSSHQLWYVNKNCEPPHNIEVYKSADPIVRIPEKYLPLDIAKKSYVDTAISDAITKTLNTEV